LISQNLTGVVCWVLHSQKSSIKALTVLAMEPFAARANSAIGSGSNTRGWHKVSESLGM